MIHQFIQCHWVGNHVSFLTLQTKSRLDLRIKSYSQNRWRILLRPKQKFLKFWLSAIDCTMITVDCHLMNFTIVFLKLTFLGHSIDYFNHAIDLHFFSYARNQGYIPHQHPTIKLIIEMHNSNK